MDSPELEKQYGQVLAEYRFQVQLNWDRAKHYFTFNTLLVGADVALYKDNSSPSQAGVSALLCIAALNSFHGVAAIERGHDYYRHIRKTKAALEERLNLGPFAIETTPGMRRDVDRAMEGTPASGARRFGSITNQARLLLRIIGSFAPFGAAYAG